MPQHPTRPHLHRSRTGARLAIAALVALSICAVPSLASAKGAPNAAPTTAPPAGPKGHRPPPRPMQIRGTVATVADAGFTVTSNGRTATVTVNDATTYDVVTAAALSDVTVGTYISFGAAKGSTTVDRIAIRPAPATARPGPEGTVSAVDGTTITVTTAKGDVTITVADTVVVSKVAAGTFADVVVGATVAVDPAGRPAGPPASGKAPAATLTARHVVIDARTAA